MQKWLRIFLSGGSGFIGKNIIEQLGTEYQILSPTHQELELLDKDAVCKFFDEHEIDIVIHSAVRPGHRNAKDSSNQLDHNTRMFFNLADNANRFKKLIFLNSGLVYGLKYYRPKMKEEYFGVYLPEDEGGYSKYLIAKHIEQADNMIDLRLFGVFGKYEDYAIRFISNMICKALFDLPLTMKKNRKFSYLFVNDLMPILKYFVHNEVRHKAYNVTPDEPVELYVLAEKVRQISGKKLEIKVAKEGMGVEYSGDNSRLRQEIRDLKFTDVDQAISQLYEWYGQNRQMIKRELLLVDK